jgi:hypothetical protein
MMGGSAVVAGRPGGSVLIEESNSSEISEVERKANRTQKKVKGGGNLSEIVPSENTKTAAMPAADIKRQIQKKE